MRTTLTNTTTNRTTASLRRLAAVLAVTGAAAGACGSSPFDGGADAPADGLRLGGPESADDRSDGASTDREQIGAPETEGVETRDACGPLDEARRLGERYGELVEGVVRDAERTAEDNPDVDREEVARDALREMIVELDPVADDLLDAYRDAAEAAPAELASDLDVLVDFTDDIVESWRDLLDQPDAGAQDFLDTIFAGDREQLREAVASTQRVNAFTIDECGFELSS